MVQQAGAKHVRLPEERESVQDKMDRVLFRIRREGSIAFDKLFDRSRGRSDLVTTFLAVLELARVGIIRIYQVKNRRNHTSVFESRTRAGSRSRMSGERYKPIVECLIFLSDKPISRRKLQEIIDPERPEDIREAITMLMDEYSTSIKGFRLREVAGGYQFRSDPGVQGVCTEA